MSPKHLVRSADDEIPYIVEVTSEHEHTRGQAARMTKAEAARQASLALRERTGRRVALAADLLAEGKTRREIGREVAKAEGEPTAFPKSTVRGWLRIAARVKPSG